jgi:O-antigen ligase
MTAARSQWAIGACLACLGLMIVVPPLNPLHLAPIPSFIEEWLALAFGTAAVALALWARGFRIDGVPRLVPWLVAFAALLAAQAAARDLPYREQALVPALFVLWAAALAWVGFTLRQTVGGAGTARVIAASVLAVACLSALIALIQSVGLQTPLNWLISRPQSARAYANLNQPNLLADLLALGAASAVFLRGDGTLGRGAAAGALALLAGALALTGSRSGLVFAAWIVAWAAWWAQAHPGDAARGAMRAALLFLAVLLLVHVALAFHSGTSTSVPVARGDDLAAGAEAPSSLPARGYIWTQAARIFGESPWLGVGPGMFAWNFFLGAPGFHGAPIPGGERFAHDFVLQLLAETGIAGAGLVLIPLALWFASNRRAPAEPWRWWTVAFAGVGVLHSLVENPLWYAHFLGPFALVLGLGDRAIGAIKGERVLRAVAPALVIAGAVPLVGAAVGYRDAVAWLDGRSGGTLASMERSVLRPYAEVLASSVLLTPDRYAPEDVALSERVVRFMPIDLAVYRHIRLLSQAGRSDEARALLERALVASPGTLNDLRRELEAASGSAQVRELLQLLDARVGK